MLTEERQQAIASYINNHSICRVNELCKLTKSSESTIRRDLIELEKRGVIVRVHGGARSLQDYSRDVEQQVRFNLNVDKKREIARFAVINHITRGDHIFLDAGTTTYEMVSFLREIKDLHVLTNGVDIALACLENGIQTRLLGGEAKIETHAVVGNTAMKQLQEMNLSVSFIGANGLTAEGQFTTPDPAEAGIKKTAIEQAKEAFVLIDSSKIGAANFASFAHINEAILITNHLTIGKKNLLPKQIRVEEARS